MQPAVIAAAANIVFRRLAVPVDAAARADEIRRAVRGRDGLRQRVGRKFLQLHVYVFESVEEAMKKWDNRLMFATGSLYLVGDVDRALEGKENNHD